MDVFNWVKLVYLFLWVYYDCHSYSLLFLSEGSVYLSMLDITSKCCNTMYVVIDWTSHMSYIMCNMFLMYLHTYFIYLHPTVAMGLNVKERFTWSWCCYLYLQQKQRYCERERERPHWKFHSFRNSINHSSFTSPWF